MNIPRFSGVIQYSGNNQQIKQAVEKHRHFIETQTPPMLTIDFYYDDKLIQVDFPDNGIEKLLRKKMPDVMHWPRRIVDIAHDFWFSGKKRIILAPNSAVYFHRIGTLNFQARHGLFGIPLEKPVKNLERVMDFIREFYPVNEPL